MSCIKKFIEADLFFFLVHSRREKRESRRSLRTVRHKLFFLQLLDRQAKVVFRQRVLPPSLPSNSQHVRTCSRSRNFDFIAGFSVYGRPL